jgi:hypothetical protein
MRWKLIRRRLSISSPRMTVRSHLPWPLRWAAVAVMLGFSGAAALWAFEFGQELAGLDHGARAELDRLRGEVVELRADRDKAQSIANTAESLLKAEKVAQERLASQLRQAEADNISLKADLGFFERLLPATGGTEAVTIRGLQLEPAGAGRWRYQLLVMQSGRPLQAFEGRYELSLTGMRDGKPWSQPLAGGAQPLQVKQYTRVEGYIDTPPQAMVKTVELRVLDNRGAVQATQSLRL